MHGMTNSGKLFVDELINWLIDKAGVDQFKCQISVYYKYAPYGLKLVVLCFIDDCVYCYTYEELVNFFVDTIEKVLHLRFLGYAHWFLTIRISQDKDYFILVDQGRYATSVVENYLDTATIKLK